MDDETPRAIKIGDAISQLLNVALMPGNRQTNANESLSGRAYRQGWRLRILIDALFFWQESHCKSSHEADVARARKLVRASDVG